MDTPPEYVSGQYQIASVLIPDDVLDSLSNLRRQEKAGNPNPAIRANLSSVEESFVGGISAEVEQNWSIIPLQHKRMVLGLFLKEQEMAASMRREIQKSLAQDDEFPLEPMSAGLKKTVIHLIGELLVRQKVFFEMEKKFQLKPVSSLERESVDGALVLTRHHSMVYVSPLRISSTGKIQRRIEYIRVAARAASWQGATEFFGLLQADLSIGGPAHAANEDTNEGVVSSPILFLQCIPAINPELVQDEILHTASDTSGSITKVFRRIE